MIRMIKHQVPYEKHRNERVDKYHHQMNGEQSIPYGYQEPDGA